VERNREWFKVAKPKIEAVWQTVLEERKTGHDHRASKKRTSSKEAAPAINNTITVIKEGSTTLQNTYKPSTGSICLVKLEQYDI
jgi:hypothetical protein